MSRPTLIFAAKVAAVLVCFAAVAVSVFAWANPGYEPLEFDRNKWLKADAETRGHMVQDFLSRNSLVGMKRKAVVQLLGEPDEDQVDLNRFRYYLGNMGRNPDMPFFWGFSLLIEFDESKQVVQIDIAD